MAAVVIKTEICTRCGGSGAHYVTTTEPCPSCGGHGYTCWQKIPCPAGGGDPGA